MVVYKRDMAFNEPFVKPIHGLYIDHAISVEEFKEKNAALMKNCWINTRHGESGEQIYELYNPVQEGEIVKESLQEWLCDNRNEITQCIGIALRNHKRSYAEWFKYVDDRSGPDELAIYGLSRQHGVHTAIFNKSYVWTTLADHVLRSDEEILGLCGVNLLFLDYTTYGIIKNIRAPNPTDTKKTSAPTAAHKKLSKTTCRDSARKPTKQTGPKPNTTRGKRSRTLSESRQETFGISALVRTIRSNRQTIDYLALNDGLEEDMPDSPKRRKKNSHRPRGKPSATRQAANKYTNPTESKPPSSTKDSSELQAVPPPPLKKTNDELPGIPTSQTLSELQAAPPPPPKITNDELPGIPTDQTLPDLVLERGGTNYQEVALGGDTTGTEEELDTAATLLSLGTI